MRVVYYTESPFLDLSLSFVREMSRLVELHALLQVRPRAWPEGLLDLPPADLPAGVVPAEPALAGLPAGVCSAWHDAASLHLVVHNHPQVLHPANGWVSHQAVRFMRALAPQVIHLEGLPGRLAWALPELRGAPVVLSVHDPEPHSGHRNWKDSLARRLAFGRAGRFILHNRAQQADFAARNRVPAERIDAIPLGAYDAFRHWATRGVGDDGRTILFFGKISAYKGLETLYEAAPLVAERVPGVRLVVAGRPLAGYALPAPPALANGGRVEVLARSIGNAELARLFQEATIVVCPYTDATQSGVILTAYAFARPVVATRVGGLPEYVWEGETGVLVPPRAPAALADALAGLLVRLAAEPGLRERYARRIRERCAGELSWARIARETLEVYRRAAESSHRSPREGE